MRASFVLGALICVLIAGCGGDEESASKDSTPDTAAALAGMATRRAIDAAQTPAQRPSTVAGDASASPLATPTPAPPTAIPTATPVPVGNGQSRTAPVPLGVASRVGDWTITVLGIEPNGTQQVLQKNQFNKPPAPGKQFFLVQVSATYRGTKEPATLLGGLTFRAVGASNVAYDSGDDCGVVPAEIDSFKQVFQGGTLTGNLCWSVTAPDASSLQIRAEPAFSFDSAGIWFSLAGGPR